MRTRQATLVPLAVCFDVLLVLLTQLLNRCEDLPVRLVGRISGVARIAHGDGGEVRVATRAVPVAGAGLRVECYSNLELLANALHDVPRHPHVIARVDTLAWPDLVLPLAWCTLRLPNWMPSVEVTLEISF